MDARINYTTQSGTPSDYACKDGELSVALDVYSENGSLKPVPKPKTLFNLPTTSDVLYQHKINNIVNYVVWNENRIYWTADGTKLNVLNSESYDREDIKSVQSLGNTLIILSDIGQKYFLWQSGSYKYLGTGLPECPMTFGLSNKTGSISDEFTVTLPNGVYICSGTSSKNSIFNFQRFHDLSDELAEENSNAVSDAIIGQVNKIANEQGNLKGKFVYPFFVRYAIRLIDGTSLIHHSSPILMIPSTGIVPEVVCLNDYNSSTRQTELKLKARVASYSLDFAVTSQDVIDELKRYSDIISSIDVFISAPIYQYKQSGKVQGLMQSSLSGKAVAKLDDGQYSLQQYGDGLSWSTPNSFIRLPSFTDAEVAEDISTRAQFYLLKSFNVNELSTNRQVIEIPNDYLENLVNRELMPDDYDSHDLLTAENAIVYNSRLNLCGCTKMLFKGHGPEQFCYNNSTDTETLRNYLCNVTIKSYKGNITVQSDSLPIGVDGGYGYFFFYPNTNAVEASIGEVGGTIKYVKLKPHQTLNGAFFFNGWKTIEESGSTEAAVTPSEDQTIDIKNKLYTSEVNNPFFFPVTNINTIGDGEILALSSAAKALSQGQFGQFPLYAFTSEGIWALGVSSTGGFDSKQPVVRDVCINAKSITQLDSSVAFISDNGIMLLSGSSVTSISKVIDDYGETPFSIDVLPHCSEALFGADESEPALDTVAFREFLKEAEMLYDYASQRLIVFNPQYSYSYVLNIVSQNWTMMRSNIKSKLNSYPNCIALDNAGKLLDYSIRVENTTPAIQVIISRPIKLEYPDSLKTITSIVQRGTFTKGNIQVILYGSRNLEKWFPVSSSTDHFLRGFSGTAYKYYRIVIKSKMKDNESLSGCTIQYAVRDMDQQR